MDDSCAVCADTLEWVAYGPCGHREVCSTCVARLRFICDDRKCCICKTESDKVFVTKALGDYTRIINDFAVLPSEVREGRVGSYWYHEDTQMLFDDVDQYRITKAMCKLSCSVCDKMDENTNDGPRQHGRFRNIDQLKGHLFHRHRLLMCSLCLEGRKVFICEQKLYTRAQLNQHISTGDSEVDGSESERGGFMGHPLCEFCKTPFYGDNELYLHMSTEYYRCHICQRQHPGQYEYFKNYDDLETHFRGEHFLCEDEACLAKKFTVFQSEAELKRHNVMEHGGRMSRSQRNAALQIPTSFRYRRSNEQDNRRRRGRIAFHDPPDTQLSQAIEASLGTAGNDNTLRDPSPSSAPRVEAAIDQGFPSDIDPLVFPAFESLASTDSEAPSRYREALGGSRNVRLAESSFPPLPTASSGSSQQHSKQNTTESSSSTMASHLQHKNNRNVTTHNNSSPVWPAASRRNVQAVSKPSQSNNVVAPVTSQSKPSQSRPVNNVVAPVTSQSTRSGPALPSYASSAQIQARPTTVPGSTSRNVGRISHSSSATNFADTESLEPAASDFPPVSAAQIRKLPVTSQAAASSVEDIQTANKSLVEKIRTAVGDEDGYSAFKNISGKYRQGSIGTRQYLDYVEQYGLSHLVFDLARLCPDPEKQKELIDTYNVGLQSNSVQEKSQANESVWWKDNNSKTSKKGKGKTNLNPKSAAGGSSSNNLADTILASVRELQSSYKAADEDVEVLTKDGYRRSTKEISKAPVEEHQGNLNSDSRIPTEFQNGLSLAGGGSNQNLGNGGKQRKKTSKFHRARLGDGSMAALLDPRYSDHDRDPGPLENSSNGNNQNPSDGVPVRGVWRKGGGAKLFL